MDRWTVLSVPLYRCWRWFNGFNWEGLKARTLPSPMKRAVSKNTSYKSVSKNTEYCHRRELKQSPFFICWGTHRPEAATFHASKQGNPPPPQKPSQGTFGSDVDSESQENRQLFIFPCVERFKEVGKHVACYISADRCFTHADKGSRCGVKTPTDDFLEGRISWT